jgi:hypothetical protein
MGRVTQLTSKREETREQMQAHFAARIAESAGKNVAARGGRSSEIAELESPVETNVSPPAILQRMWTDAHVAPVTSGLL